MNHFGKEYHSEYYRKNRESILEKGKIYRDKNAEKRKLNGYEHYTQGKKCEKCKKDIVNTSKGLCLICFLTRNGCKDKESQAHRLKYPEKIRARKKVSQAIRLGKLIRGNCLICKKPNAEAHHEDYTKPFDIMWLCKLHHSKHEKDKRRSPVQVR